MTENRTTSSRRKIVRIGDSHGIILPKVMRNHLEVEIGDTLFLTETPEGFVLSAKTPEFTRQMAAARSVMRRHRKALKKLAD